jgi:hypothetical protein
VSGRSPGAASRRAVDSAARADPSLTTPAKQSSLCSANPTESSFRERQPLDGFALQSAWELQHNDGTGPARWRRDAAPSRRGRPWHKLTFALTGWNGRSWRYCKPEMYRDKRVLRTRLYPLTDLRYFAILSGPAVREGRQELHFPRSRRIYAGAPAAAVKAGGKPPCGVALTDTSYGARDFRVFGWCHIAI